MESEMKENITTDSKGNTKDHKTTINNHISTNWITWKKQIYFQKHMHTFLEYTLSTQKFAIKQYAVFHQQQPHTCIMFLTPLDWYWLS